MAKRKGGKKKTQVVEDNKPVPPEGCVAFGISNKQMIEKNLKTGELISDTVPYAIFDKRDELDDVQRWGFNALFHPVQKELETYDRDDLLIVADPEKKYGENWYVCTTGDAFERELKFFKDKEEEERQRKIREEEAERRRKQLEEEEARRIYEITPIIAKQYVSETDEDTTRSISWLNIKSNRPKITYAFRRKLGEFGLNFTLNVIDAENCDEFRPHKDPSFSVVKLVREIALQDTSSYFSNKEDKAIQSQLVRSVNKTTQYCNNDLDNTKVSNILTSKDFILFLHKTENMVRLALQENEIVNPFINEFECFPIDDNTLGDINDSTIQSLRVFTDLEHSKGKVVTSIAWHPKKRDIVACSVSETYYYETKMVSNMNPPNSFILIWSFEDLIHPIMILQSYFEITCFNFHPKRQDIIIAGCGTGQVIQYDLSEAWEERERSLKKSPDSNTKAPADPLKSPYVTSENFSVHDRSHSRAIGDIKWIPGEMEINRKGVASRSETDEIHQFFTVAGDGAICLWDLDYKSIARKVASIRGQKLDDSEISWIPRYTYIVDLQTLEPGSSCLYRMLEFNFISHGIDTKLKLATERGALISVDFKSEESLVQWSELSDHRPISSLRRSPFFPDIYLTVSSWGFHIYRKEGKTPIFVSSKPISEYSVGSWSISRPGVIFLGRQDGHIEIWDFTDQSNSASLIHPVCPVGIISMEFRVSKESPRQYLAIGDVNGNLHVLSIPSNLRKAVPNEEGIISSHFEREDLAVTYHKEITQHIEIKPGFSSAAQKKAKEVKTEVVVEDNKHQLLIEKIQLDYVEIEHKILLDFGIITGDDSKDDA